MASRPQKKAMKGAERAEKQWVDNVLLLSLNCLSEARKKGELYLQLPDLTDSIGHFSISHGNSSLSVLPTPIRHLQLLTSAEFGELLMKCCHHKNRVLPRSLLPASTWCPRLCSSPWEACPFLNGHGGGVNGEGGDGGRWEWGGMGGKEGRETYWYVK